VATLFTYWVLKTVHRGDILAGEERTYEIKMKVVFLLEKAEVMFMLGRGIRIAVVICHYGVNGSVVQFITKI